MGDGLSRIRRLRFWDDAFFNAATVSATREFLFRPTSFRDPLQESPLFPWRYTPSFEKLPSPSRHTQHSKHTHHSRSTIRSAYPRKREREERRREIRSSKTHQQEWVRSLQRRTGAQRALAHVRVQCCIIPCQKTRALCPREWSLEKEGVGALMLFCLVLVFWLVFSRDQAFLARS